MGEQIKEKTIIKDALIYFQPSGSDEISEKEELLVLLSSEKIDEDTLVDVRKRAAFLLEGTVHFEYLEE